MTYSPAPKAFYVGPKLKNTFLDRSGERPDFREVINRMAKAEHGPEWMCPVSRLAPMTLPPMKSDASVDQLFYAVHLLEYDSPGLEIERIDEQLDENLPDFLQRHSIDFDINTEKWNHAQSLSCQNFDHQKKTYTQVGSLLDMFANAACKGEIATYAWRGSGEAKIPRQRWSVNTETLRSRYDGSELEPSEGSSEHFLALILVNGEEAARLIGKLNKASLEREWYVRSKLVEAKQISDTVVPHRTMRQLKRIISKFIPCTFERATIIIQEETGGCWSRKGPRKKPVFGQVNQIDIVKQD